MFLIRAAGCNHAGVIGLLVLNQGFNGAVVVGHLISPQDLAPNFSGTVYGMMNLVGMTTGILVPSITGALNTHYVISFSIWFRFIVWLRFLQIFMLWLFQEMGLMAATIIYTIGGGVLTASGVAFFLFASADTQPWNEIEE